MERGQLADEIRKWVPRIKTLFIPEKLDFLAAGGRRQQRRGAGRVPASD